MQRTPPNWFRPVYYTSRRLSQAEKNYSTTEKEALGMIYSISKFRHYLLGRKFTFHMDHSALLSLVNNHTLTGRLARWMLLLQEFDFDIHHRPGVQHVVADYLRMLRYLRSTIRTSSRNQRTPGSPKCPIFLPLVYPQNNYHWTQRNGLRYAADTFACIWTHSTTKAPMAYGAAQSISSKRMLYFAKHITV